MVCSPCRFSSRSSGADSSRLAPMPVSSRSGAPAPRTEVRSLTPSTSTNRMDGADSGKGAHARDVLAHDERLDRLGALVGVQGLHVGHVPHHVEVQQYAVAAEQIAGLGDDLTGLAG